MTTLADRLKTDLTAAMKARDSLRRDTLRMAIAAVMTAGVAGRQAHELSDEEVVAVLVKESRKRQEAADAFRAAGRDAQADAELAEQAVLAEYLPAPLTDEQIAELVEAAVAETGASGAGQLGQVMGWLRPRTAGRADGAALAARVRERLSQD